MYSQAIYLQVPYADRSVDRHDCFADTVRIHIRCALK